jgi:hypothetical protein
VNFLGDVESVLCNVNGDSGEWWWWIELPYYYEAGDAFNRYVPKRMQKRWVEWVAMKDGKKFHLVAGKLNRSVGNPTFNPVLKPGGSS